MKPLTKLVVDYIEHEGIEVHDSLSLEIPDNLKVGAQDPLAPAEHVKRLDTRGVDAVVLSACVQMPSLASIQPTQDRLGLPVVTAAAATSTACCRNWAWTRACRTPANCCRASIERLNRSGRRPTCPATGSRWR